MNKLTNEVISNNEKYFYYYLIAPKVITIISAVIFCILGMVFSAISTPLFILIFWFGGGVVCLIEYVSLKILFSYIILHIYYLKKIAEKMEDQDNKTATINETEELPEI